jgi:hypothetical protein
MQTMLDGRSGSSEGHKRNCILIACYLGLSQHTIENIPFGSSSSSKSRPCRTCGRRITLGNFAKHLATHDPNKKYKCERCGHEDNRSDNFAKHDKSCRRKRMPQDQSEGLHDHEQPPCLAERARLTSMMICQKHGSAIVSIIRVLETKGQYRYTKAKAFQDK